MLAALLGAGDAVYAATGTPCTAYCEASGNGAGSPENICHLDMQAKPCVAAQGTLPTTLPQQLQAALLAGKVANPFRAQYPIPADVLSPTFDRATVAGLMALPLQLDGNVATEEWLVYAPNPPAGEPPYFWIMQNQGKGKYRILLEHSGQMLWVSPESLDGYQTLRSARFAEMDAGGKTGTFTDLRDWQYTSGIYSLSKSEGMAAGPVDNPAPL
jgi:hypothetical protein